jgi:integrase
VIGENGAVAGIDNRVAKEATKLLKDLGLHRPGLRFYALKHTFEAIGGESRDQPAVDYVMGHASHHNDMSTVYRERVTDERLKAVADHVRAWLFCLKVRAHCDRSSGTASARR